MIDTPFVKRTNILIAAVLLGAAAFVVFVIFPIFGNIQKSRDRLLLALQDELALKDQIAAVQEYRALAKEVRENLALLEDMLVDVQFPVTFVQFLERLAGENSLSIEVVSPAGGRAGAGEEVVFQLKIEGTPSDLTRFLTRLETGPYLVRITQMQILRLEENMVSANISLGVLAK